MPQQRRGHGANPFLQQTGQKNMSLSCEPEVTFSYLEEHPNKQRTLSLRPPRHNHFRSLEQTAMYGATTPCRIATSVQHRCLCLCLVMVGTGFSRLAHDVVGLSLR